MEMAPHFVRWPEAAKKSERIGDEVPNNLLAKYDEMSVSEHTERRDARAARIK